ncbi:MAG TPA: phosphoribosylanthranilate isomerase [Bacillota bacterium]|nr:phosphoribosylanthranilate isomerase [Bacillota bacterium]
MAACNPVKVKICGIRDVPAALAAAEAGADALGFVFAPGPRQVSRETARAICSELPPFVARVGVFVDAPAALAEETADYCGLDVLQLHGNEPPEYCRGLKYRVVKAFRIKNAASLEMVKKYRCAAVLLDTYVSGLAGGTGCSFDWTIAGELASARPVILAGGLNPENVGRAIEVVRPYAVDVSGGVETNGKKDIEKIRMFIRRVREVDKT